MNLILDIGNSRTKAYIFEGKEIVYREQALEAGIEFTASLINRFPETKNGIIVRSGSHDPALSEFCRDRLAYFIELGPKTPLPIQNLYKTKDTLGYDRIAGIVGANTLYPEENVLVIDAGTALTYDLVTKDGEFVGGNISPGLHMRFEALARFTKNLPRTGVKEQIPLVGKNTEDAIASGVEHGILEEIDGMINKFRSAFGSLRVIIAGGDAFFFDKRLKNSIFVLPELTAFGLNRILEFNVHKRTI